MGSGDIGVLTSVTMGSNMHLSPQLEFEMPRHYGYNEIEHPEAYADAIKRNIYARATAKRRREWSAAHPELAAWYSFQGQWDEPGRNFTRHPLGTFPTFAREGLDKWGSLTEKGTATLQRIYDERTANLAKRAEQRAAEAASAVAWAAGRQVVEGVIISVKETEGYSPSRWAPAATVYKMLVKRDDGSKVYLTVPRAIEDAFMAEPNTTGMASWLKGKRVRVTVTVEPKAEEPTFAFGSRPSKGEVL